ncbi:MAG: flagellar biosynthetic protein FliR [Myxococcota bacterium]|nr:flagellar biosynthetic protein FliR [Myxococcota bacterium]
MEVFLEQVGIQLNYTRELLIVALILGRTMPMVYLTPFLAGQIAPTEVKIGFGLMLTILLWPAARGAIDGAEIPFTAIGFFFLMLKEVFVGFVIGFLNSHIFLAMDMAGRIIDTARGVSMSEVQVPHSKQRATITGNLYYQLFLVIFLLAGAHHIFFEAYFNSFVAIPLDQFLASPAGMEPFIDFVILKTAEILMVAVMISAPILAATFITDLVFGILNRVAPQLNAYFMSMPVKALGGVIMILVGFSTVLARFEMDIQWLLVSTTQGIELLSSGMEP